MDSVLNYASLALVGFAAGSGSYYLARWLSQSAKKPGRMPLRCRLFGHREKSELHLNGLATYAYTACWRRGCPFDSRKGEK